MKYLFIFVFASLVLWGCASTVDTALMTPSERLDYATHLYKSKKYENALKEFQTLVLQYPGSSVIDSAQYYLAMTRFQREEYILAAYQFSKLINNMPSSKYVPEAQYMLADCYYLLSPNYALDQKYTKKSIQEFQAFIDFFPTNPKVPEAEKKIAELNNKLAHKEYNSAYIYRKLGYYKAAIIYYDFLLDDFHDTKYAPLAMYDKIQILANHNHNSEALAEISKFIERYPDNSHLTEIKKLKTTLEAKLSAAN